MKSLKAIVLILFISIILTHCSKDSSSISELIDEGVILTIRDKGYKLDDFSNFLQAHGIEEMSQIENRDKLLSNMLDYYIDQKLLEEEIKQEKVNINNKEMQSFIDDNLDTQDIRGDERKASIVKDLMMQKYLMMKLTAGLNITDKEIQDYYNQNKDKFYMRERITITQILFEDQQSAENLYERLIKKPALLKELLARKEVEDIKVKGLIMATYQKGELPEQVESYLWKLPVEGINKPYISDSGDVMIFVVMDKKGEELAPLEEVKHKIIKKLALIKVDAMSQQLLNKLAKKNNIKIYQNNLDFIYSGKYMNSLI